jgi:hypothetical protein
MTKLSIRAEWQRWKFRRGQQEDAGRTITVLFICNAWGRKRVSRATLMYCVPRTCLVDSCCNPWWPLRRLSRSVCGDLSAYCVAVHVSLRCVLYTI